MLMQITQTVRKYEMLRTSLALPARFPFRLPSLLQAITLLIVALVSLPIGYLIVRALGAGQEGLDYLLDTRTLTVIANSLLLMVAVVVSAALVGIPFAWLTARTDLPM